MTLQLEWFIYNMRQISDYIKARISGGTVGHSPTGLTEINTNPDIKYLLNFSQVI